MLSTAELEARLCYAIVAGKTASFADRATERLWMDIQPGETPFGMFRRLGSEIEVRGRLRRLEADFLAEAAKRGLTPRELDWEIWGSSSRSRGNIQEMA